MVSNSNNAGSGSLRQAILDANASPGLDEIHFSMPSTVPSIRPTSPLPEITDPVVIDGTTHQAYLGRPVLEINGALAGAFGVNGIVISGGGNSTVRGMIINGFSQNAIVLNGGGNNVIQGNFLGTDRSGTIAAPNGFAIWVSNSISNLIGGHIRLGGQRDVGQCGHRPGNLGTPGTRDARRGQLHRHRRDRHPVARQWGVGRVPLPGAGQCDWGDAPGRWQYDLGQSTRGHRDQRGLGNQDSGRPIR